jgi:hypothetical protein
MFTETAWEGRLDAFSKGEEENSQTKGKTNQEAELRVPM